MNLYPYYDVVRDANGNAVTSATVNIYRISDGSLATVYDKSGNSVTQPLATDQSGAIVNGAAGEDGIGFWALAGRYRLEVSVGAEVAALPELQLGPQITKLDDSTDLDTIAEPGAYDVYTPVNSPDGASSTTWWSIEVIRHSVSTDNAIQVATRLSGGGDERHFRVRKLALWGPWARLLDSADPAATRALIELDNVPNVDTTVAANVTIADSGDNFVATNVEDALAEEADARQAFEATKGQADGLAPLDANAKVPTSYLPALSSTNVTVVASEAEQLALTAQEGDVAVRSDISTSYIHNGGSAGTMADWTEIQTPTKEHAHSTVDIHTPYDDLDEYASMADFSSRVYLMPYLDGDTYESTIASMYEGGGELYRNRLQYMSFPTAFGIASMVAELGDVFSADKPIVMTDYDAGEPLPPLCAAGRRFAFYTSRNAPHTVNIYAPYVQVTVKYKLNSTDMSVPTQSLVIPAGTVGTMILADAVGEHYFEASSNILMSKKSSNETDKFWVPPMSRRILMTDATGTILTWPRGGSYTEANGYYNSDNTLLAATKIDDGAGNEAVQSLPVAVIGDTYLVSSRISDYSITAIEPCMVTVYDKDGNVIATHDLSAASETSPVTVTQGLQTDPAINDWVIRFEGTAPFLLRSNLTGSSWVEDHERYHLGHRRSLRSKYDDRANLITNAIWNEFWDVHVSGHADKVASEVSLALTDTSSITWAFDWGTKEITGNVVFGTTAGTAAEGDHSHDFTKVNYFVEGRDVTAGINDAVPVHSWEVSGAETNIDIALVPKGTGSIAAQVADGTTAGGNKRGAHAVDLQTERANALGVASGLNSVLTGGKYNYCNGHYATVSGGYGNWGDGNWSSVGGGQSNQADGDYSTVPGGFAGLARGLYGRYSYASGSFSGSSGKAQIGTHVLRNDTTDAITTVLVADGTGASTTTVSVLPDNHSYGVVARVIARDTSTGDTKVWEIKGGAKRGSGAATVTLVGTPTKIVTAADTGAPAWDCNLVVNTTRGSVEVEVVGEATKTIHWVCKLDTVEVG